MILRGKKNVIIMIIKMKNKRKIYCDWFGKYCDNIIFLMLKYIYLFYIFIIFMCLWIKCEECFFFVVFVNKKN